MILVDCQQGTEEWKRARLGVVTASGADSLLSPKTLKPSAQAAGYMARLIAETILGEPLDDVSSQYMERGTDLEPEARKWYEWEKDCDVEQVGFITTDDGRLGCSPDGLVGADGGLEIKCPAAHTHVAYSMDPDSLVAAYRSQVQVSLLVTGRAWWDLLSFNPVIPPVVVRVLPDESYRAAFVPVLKKFLADMDAALAKMRPAVAAKRDSNPFL